MTVARCRCEFLFDSHRCANYRYLDCLTFEASATRYKPTKKEGGGGGGGGGV